MKQKDLLVPGFSEETKMLTIQKNQGISFVQYCCIYKEMLFNVLTLVKVFTL